jgi:DNA-binding MarR family transcriptional regulator
MGRVRRAESGENWDAGREAWSLLFRLMMAERVRFPAIAAEFGLSPAQAHLLWELSPGVPTPMSALAGTMACDASNITGLVDRLEAQGFVARGTGRDRRVKTISTTTAGEDVRRRLIERLNTPPPSIASLTRPEQEQLLALLRKAVPTSGSDARGSG